MGREFQTKPDGSLFTASDYTQRHAEVLANRYDDGLGDCKIASFQRLVGNLDSIRVLDLGCGEGTFSRLVAEHGGWVVATDFSEPMVMAAAERVDAPVVRGSADAIPCGNHSFDLVLALDIIEHLYQPDLALDEIWRVLTPGGRLVIATDRDGLVLGDLPMRMPRPLRKLLIRKPARGTASDPGRYRTPMCTHTHEFPLPELLALTAKHGFRLQKLDTYPHRNRYGGWGRTVELVARGPLRKWKWNYVMLVLTRE